MILAFHKHFREEPIIFVNPDNIRFGYDEDKNICIWTGYGWYWGYIGCELEQSLGMDREKINAIVLERIKKAINLDTKEYIREVYLELSQCKMVRIYEI